MEGHIDVLWGMHDAIETIINAMTYFFLFSQGHIGSVVAAILAGLVAFLSYPDIKYCFLVIAFAALLAIFFVQYLPEGDPLMGRGFMGKVAMDEHGHLERLESDESTVAVDNQAKEEDKEPPEASSYKEVFSDVPTGILCLTGFFFQ
jgi:hypothetical protein